MCIRTLDYRRGVIDIRYRNTNTIVSDILTKALGSLNHEKITTTLLQLFGDGDEVKEGANAHAYAHAYKENKMAHEEQSDNGRSN